MKNLGLCHRHEGGICTKKGEDILIVKRRERESAGVHTRTTEERVHLAFQVTSNSTSVLCRKERWKKENGVGLLISQ